MKVNSPAQGYVTPALYKCAYPTPYPEVRVVAPNPYYAQLLLEDYAGTVSEFSAISQYIYHHFVLEHKYKDVADLLACISLVEMHHLELLAETIIMLGVDPRFRTVKNNNIEEYWDASFIFYGISLCDQISSDIAGEWAAIESYRKHQHLIDDPNIRQLLERIILDELHHIDLLNQIMQKYCQPQLPQQAPVNQPYILP